jgi:hypothetical protein
VVAGLHVVCRFCKQQCLLPRPAGRLGHSFGGVCMSRLVVFACREAMSHLIRASVRQALSSAVQFVCMHTLHSELLSELV